MASERFSVSFTSLASPFLFSSVTYVPIGFPTLFEASSDIILTAFTYDNDDFDENNNYRGNSKTTITIKRN